MDIRFTIKCEDGTVIESHDENGVQVRDHAHALPPHNNSPWLEYILTIEGNGVKNVVSCIFPSGLFKVNGTLIHPANELGDALTFREDPQDFEVSPQWQFFNGKPYFPIAGRRTFAGEWGGITLWFCGWKRREGNKTIERCIYLNPNGQILIS